MEQVLILQKNNLIRLYSDKNELNIVNIDPINKGPYILESLKIDKNTNKTDALNDIYKVLRPGEAPSVDIAVNIHQLIF